MFALKSNSICSNPTLFHVSTISRDPTPQHWKYLKKITEFIITRKNRYQEPENLRLRLFLQRHS